MAESIFYSRKFLQIIYIKSETVPWSILYRFKSKLSSRTVFEPSVISLRGFNSSKNFHVSIKSRIS